jgi:hypothetical protein
MAKYTLQFKTEIYGEITIDANNQEEALAIGDKLAHNTLNYDELTNKGTFAPTVETECINVY